MLRSFITCQFLVFALFVGGVAQALPPSPSEFVQTQDLKMEQLISKIDTADQEDALEKFFEHRLDDVGFPEKILGWRWQRLSEEEQAQYQSILRELLIKTFIRNIQFKPSPQNYRLKWYVDRVEGERGIATALITHEDTETEVEFLLHRHSNSWRFRDVSRDGISLLRTYERNHRRILRAKGFEELLNSMNTQLGHLKSQIARHP